MLVEGAVKYPLLSFALRVLIGFSQEYYLIAHLFRCHTPTYTYLPRMNIDYRLGNSQLIIYPALPQRKICVLGKLFYWVFL